MRHMSKNDVTDKSSSSPRIHVGTRTAPMTYLIQMGQHQSLKIWDVATVNLAEWLSK
jgi:hypothetical protein